MSTFKDIYTNFYINYHQITTLDYNKSSPLAPPTPPKKKEKKSQKLAIQNTGEYLSKYYDSLAASLQSFSILILISTNASTQTFIKQLNVMADRTENVINMTKKGNTRK